MAEQTTQLVDISPLLHELDGIRVAERVRRDAHTLEVLLTCIISKSVEHPVYGIRRQWTFGTTQEYEGRIDAPSCWRGQVTVYGQCCPFAYGNLSLASALPINEGV
jgi:hypothetical protein